MSEPPLVLDTHVWIWVVNGDQSVRASVRQKIRQALETSRVLIPAICIWEVAMLWKRGRIQLREPPINWIRAALEKSGFTLATVTAEIAVESTSLPGNFHNDPADSMIVATSRLENGNLLTRDRRIIDYGKAGHVNVLVA
jgi:PIN domain nuclease of toxin-antitoxin system